MTYTFRPRGVCSQEMRVEVDDAGIIQKMEVLAAAATSRGFPPWWWGCLPRRRSTV